MYKKRLLWLKARMPGAVKDGSSLVSINLAQCLQEFFNIDLVCLRLIGCEDSRAKQLVPPFAHVRIVEPDNIGSVSKRIRYRAAFELKSWFSGTPRAVYYETGFNIRNQLAEQFSNRKYDIAFFEYFTVAPLMELASCPTILHLHDATFLTIREKAATFWDPLRRRYFERLSRDLERFEVRAAKGADRTHFISKADQKVFEARGVRASRYIPVLMPPIGDSVPPSLRQAVIVFLGHMGHLPNLDAVRWLVEEILPIVKTRQPRAKLRLIGPGLKPSERDRFQSCGVECCGEVENLHGVIEDAAVAVAPIRLGTGVKIKVLELMWHGLPTVATSVAAQSTPGELGGALIADEAESFGNCVSDLLDDLPARLSLREKAWGLLEEYHCASQVHKGVIDAFTFI